LGDSIGERRKLTPRACVSKKLGEEAKSPERNYSKRRGREENMENQQGNGEQPNNEEEEEDNP